jgi:hypothetical protein
MEVSGQLVVIFLCSWQKAPWYRFDERLDGPQNWSEWCREEKKFAPASKWTLLPWLIEDLNFFHNDFKTLGFLCSFLTLSLLFCVIVLLLLGLLCSVWSILLLGLVLFGYMVLLLVGLWFMSYSGVCRSFALMVAHGLCSSGLFCHPNISYEHFGRQS